MNKVEIRSATQAEIAAFYGDYAGWVQSAEVVVADGEVLGMGGFAEEEGRVWAVLDLSPKARSHALRIVRAILRSFQARPDEIFTLCRDERAERLLHFLGFRATGETRINVQDRRARKVMRWQN